MPYVEFGCLPTIIGTMPHKDPTEACALITHYLKDIPAWPQLTHRSTLEDMIVQYSEGFPGVVVDDSKIRVDNTRDLTKSMEELYTAYLSNNVDKYPVSPAYAAGLYKLVSMTNLNPKAVKGQITGPVTWGLTVTDETGKGIIYDDTLGDAVPKFLRLKAGWMEKQLKKLSKNTVIFIDEPYMTAFGSVGMQLSREKVISLLDEVLDGITDLKGIHCCGNTDWSILLATRLDIISLDAYNFARSLSLYPKEVKKFLGNNGTIAWGIVPNTEEALKKESVSSLKDRLEEAMAPFTRDGLNFKQLIQQGLLTPSCGLAGLTEDTSARVLDLLADLSTKMRQRYL